MDCSISLRWNGTREQTEYVGTSTLIRDSYFFNFFSPKITFRRWIFEFNDERQPEYRCVLDFRETELKPILGVHRVIYKLYASDNLYSIAFFLLILFLDPNARKFPDLNGITNVRETTEINNLSDLCTTESSFLNLPVTCIDGISLQKEYHISGQTSSE